MIVVVVAVAVVVVVRDIVFHPAVGSSTMSWIPTDNTTDRMPSHCVPEYTIDSVHH